MSESNRARIGVLVAIALIAGVGVFVWLSRSNDSAKSGTEGARTDQRDRPTRPTLEQPADAAATEVEPPPAAGGTLHERLGGREAIHRVNGKLLEALRTNSTLMANERVREVAKRVNVRELHQRLTNFLCKQAGGPCRYRGRPMKAYLAQLALTAAQWEAMEKELAQVLAGMKVPEREAKELLALVAALEKDGVTAE